MPKYLVEDEVTGAKYEFEGDREPTQIEVENYVRGTITAYKPTKLEEVSKTVSSVIEKGKETLKTAWDYWKEPVESSFEWEQLQGYKPSRAENTLRIGASIFLLGAAAYDIAGSLLRTPHFQYLWSKIAYRPEFKAIPKETLFSAMRKMTALNPGDLTSAEEKAWKMAGQQMGNLVQAFKKGGFESVVPRFGKAPTTVSTTFAPAPQEKLFTPTAKDLVRFTQALEKPITTPLLPVVTTPLQLEYKGVPPSIVKNLPNEVISPPTEEWIQKTLSRFPQKVVDQKSLEEVGNAMAKEMGIQAKINWEFKLYDKKYVSGETGRYPSGNFPHEIVIRVPKGKLSRVDVMEQLESKEKIVGGVKVGRLSSELQPTQGKIKKIIAHELSHILTPGEKHNTIFWDEVDYHEAVTLIKREMRKKGVVLPEVKPQDKLGTPVIQTEHFAGYKVPKGVLVYDAYSQPITTFKDQVAAARWIKGAEADEKQKLVSKEKTKPEPQLNSETLVTQPDRATEVLTNPAAYDEETVLFAKEIMRDYQENPLPSVTPEGNQALPIVEEPPVVLPSDEELSKEVPIKGLYTITVQTPKGAQMITVKEEELLDLETKLLNAKSKGLGIKDYPTVDGLPIIDITNKLQHKRTGSEGFALSHMFHPSRYLYAVEDFLYKIVGKHMEKGFFSALEKLAPRRIKEQLVYGYKYRSLPNYEKMKDMLFAERAIGAEKVREMAVKLKIAKPEDFRRIRQFIELGEYPDTPVGNLAKEVTDVFFEIGQEMVRYDILKPEQFEKYAQRYFPYFYKTFDGEGKLHHWFKRRMDLAYTKHRKDLPEVWRQAHGLIDDAPYPIVKRMLQEMGDLALQKFFYAIDQMYGAGTEMTGYRQLPDSKKLGALSKRYIPDALYDELMSLSYTPTEKIDQLVTSLMAVYKTGKVVLNPPAVARNIMTNFQLADWAGAPPEDVPLWVNALIDVHTRGSGYQALLKSGKLGVEFYPIEIKPILTLLETEKNMLFTAAAIPLKIMESAGNFYSLMEKWSKVAVYNANVDVIGHEAAAQLASDAIFDYTKVTPLIDQLRKGTSQGPLGRLGPILNAPFITYQSKILPRFAHTVFRRPLTLMKWKLLGTLLTWYAAKKLGLKMEEVKRMKRRMQERTGRMTELLPEKIGETYFMLDANFIDPMGNYLAFLGAVGKGDIGGMVREVGLLSSPFVQVPMGITMNRDPYTRQDIYDKYYDSPGEAFGKSLHFMYNTLSPTVMTEYGAPWKLGQALQGRPTKEGYPQPVGITARTTLLGLKAVPYSDSIEGQRMVKRLSALDMWFNMQRSKIIQRQDWTFEQKGKEIMELTTKYTGRKAEMINKWME